MKTDIQKIALKAKQLGSKEVGLPALLKMAGVTPPVVTPELRSKYADLIYDSKYTNERLPFFDYAIENNAVLPKCLRLGREEIKRIPLNGKRKPEKNPYHLLSKVVSDDNIPPSMSGVYHDNGYLVATDGYIFVKAKHDYNAEYEGQIRVPNILFELVEEKFPSYHRAVPDPDPNGLIYGELRLSDFRLLLLDAKRYTKNLYTNEGYFPVILGSASAFRLNPLEALVSCMTDLGCDLVKVSQERADKALLIISEDPEVTGLVMPIMYSSNEQCFTIEFEQLRYKRHNSILAATT